MSKYVDKNGREMNSSFMEGFSESFLADLGRVIAAWSHVENSFDILFLSFVVMRGASSGSMRDPNLKNKMGLSFKRRIKLFRKRVEELEISDGKRKHVKKILDQLSKYREERDQLAHSVFNLSIKDNPRRIERTEAIGLYKSWKNEREFEFKPVTQDQLQKLFEKIHVLYWDLHGISLDRELRDQRPRQALP